MPLNFFPTRGLVIFLLLFGLTLLSPFAAERKRKSAEVEPKSKATAKAAQKSELKQPAKSARNARQEKEDRGKQQLARKRSSKEEKQEERGKQVNKLAAKQREEKSKDKSRGNDKTGKRDDEKKNDKSKAQLAKREAEKKNDKAKEKLAKRANDKLLDKKEIAAKKSQLEKSAKNAKAAKEAELAERTAKASAKAAKQTSKAKPEEKSKEIARSEKSSGIFHLLAKSVRSQDTALADKIKELPSTNFILHPIAKPISKAEFKFSLARATAATTFDAPPPRDNGPDVIDVIEHDSPESKRLEELLRLEVKAVPVSSGPSVSRKKLDIGKMDIERIRQIQESLAKKGYYSGEISGQYGDATVEAMRRFQEEHRIDVTGYATAQSLRLLGLTDW